MKIPYKHCSTLTFAQVFASQDNVSASARDETSIENAGPPKPPRSAFMCFADAKKKDLMISYADAQTGEILQMVAVEWNKLTSRDIAFWEEEARNDKVRCVGFFFVLLKVFLDDCVLTPPTSVSADLSAKRLNTRDHGTFQNAEPRNILLLRDVRCPPSSSFHKKHARK